MLRGYNPSYTYQKIPGFVKIDLNQGTVLNLNNQPLVAPLLQFLGLH
jgi:hypothetical protein